MQIYRGWKLSAGQLAAHIAQQQVIGFKVGRSEKPRLYALPCATWQEQVDEVYGDAPKYAKRVDTGTSKEHGLTDGALLDVLTDQCGKEWDARGAVLAIITIGDGSGGKTDAAYLVPANPYWRGVVEPGEGDDETH
jgi:hypothetical protein